MRDVILITDGDKYAKEAVEIAANHLNCSCISQSSGNPTTLTGKEIIHLISQAKDDPVLVMFDDSGLNGEGSGEKALKYVARHEDIHVLGAIAVASNSNFHEWTKVNVSIDRNGHLTEFGVDKDGYPDIEIGRIAGDTVYNLDKLNLPIVVGVGDIGKFRAGDSVESGAPITIKAIKLVLERSGYNRAKSGKTKGTD